MGGGKFGATPNFPPPQIRNFEIAFSFLNFPPPKFEIRDSILHPKFSTPQIRDSRQLSRNSKFGGWKIWGGKCYLTKSSTHPNWRFEIAFSAPNFPPPKFEIAFSTPNFPPPKFEIRDSIFEFGRGVENLGWKTQIWENLGGLSQAFEIAFSAPNFPPPQIRNFEIAFSTLNFPPPKFEIRDSIFHPKFSTPKIEDSR